MTKSAEIIAVGTELLLGEIANTDGEFIAARLAEIGINVFYQTTVGDNPDRLRGVLESAARRADIIITTGGLGPTYDDLTKETIASCFGKKLLLHEPSLKRIIDFFERVKRPMTPNNEKQAYLPEGCTVLDNDWGTAPACVFEAEFEGQPKTVAMLPGPPRECRPLTTVKLIPYLLRYSDGVLVSRKLRIMGMGESAVEDRLRALMLESLNPTVAPYAKEGSVLLRITAKAATPEEGYALCDPVCEKIRSMLGDVVYGTDVSDIEETVLHIMKEKGLTLSAAESCTGGLLAKRVTDLPGASEVFKGGACTYSNEAKINILGVPSELIASHGAVSREVAASMAQNCARVFNTDIGVGISGVAGPGGGTPEKPVGYVCIAVYCNGETDVVDEVLGGMDHSRGRVRDLAVNNALNMVRKAAVRR